MPKTVTFDSFIYRADESTEEEFEIEVTANVYKATKATWDEPAYGPEVEILEATREGKDCVDTLTEAEIQKLEEEATEQAAQEEEDAQAGYADHLYQEYKENKIREMV